jgi:hypothetical protein
LQRRLAALKIVARGEDNEDRAAAWLKERLLLSPNWLFRPQVKNGPAVPPFVPPAQVGTGALGEFIMSQPTEEQIRKRAFELWEQAGKPEGREDEFWNQAQRELQGAEGRGDPLTKVPTFNSVVALPCTTPVLVRRASSVSQAAARSDGCDEAGCSNVRASHFFAATLSRANVRVESKTAVKSDTAASAAPLTADICMHAGFPRYRPTADSCSAASSVYFCACTLGSVAPTEFVLPRGFCLVRVTPPQ